MQTIQTRGRTDTDGTLTVRVPLGRPDTDFDVVLVAQPQAPPDGKWPPGYFDLFGSVEDETFTVHPQPTVPPAGDVFAEMQAFLVDVAGVDDSREAIYSPMDRE